MNPTAFLRSLEQNIDGLTPDSLTPDTVLESLPQWDSLAVLTVIALVGEQFGRTVSGAAVRNCRTTTDLYALACGS